MPNVDNVQSPITLVAYGRSGTSLLQGAFEHHPAFECVGETSELIFGTRQAIERARGIVGGRFRDGVTIEFEQQADEAVRALFLSMFPSEAERWMQKPIGHSMARRFMVADGMERDAYDAWYWNVMRGVFPQARCFTILRHPFDVVVSGRRYWKRRERQLWAGIDAMARTITHEDSMVRHAVRYDELIADPEATLAATCDALGISFAPEMTSALDRVWVPESGVGVADKQAHRERVASGFSYPDRWGSLDKGAATETQLRAIEASWAKFGHELDLDRDWRGAGVA